MFADINEDGVIDENTEILQENHYYPFGMGREGLQTPQVGVENKYGYNGKEMNDDLGLDWLDYGARWYDASIARWYAVDPLAEKYSTMSPYNYVLNNPILFIDPDGKSVYIKNEEDQRYFLEQMREVVGDAVDMFSFNKYGELGINKKAYKQLQKDEEGDAGIKEIMRGFMELKKDDAIIDFETVANNTEIVEWNFQVSGPDGKLQYYYEKNAPMKTNVNQGGQFGDAGKAKRGLALINQQLAPTETYDAGDEEKTSGCAGCIIVHELLDHGLGYIKSGYKPSAGNLGDKLSGKRRGDDGIIYHNIALRLRGSNP